MIMYAAIHIHGSDSVFCLQYTAAVQNIQEVPASFQISKYLIQQASLNVKHGHFK